jgi:thioredoxin-dependent peroxiredoxin
MSIRVGDVAPDFSLPDQDGKLVNLKSYRGESAVVVYFYPKNDTPGCTAEACLFRDQFEDFSDAGAVVIGVSNDDATSHRAFATKHRLPFTLVADRKGAVRKAWGVKRSLGILPGRSTYVVDKEGVVRHAFAAMGSVSRHVGDALTVVRGLV